MEEQKKESLEDYLGKLNIEGSRGSWIKRKRKINFVLGKADAQISRAKRACDVGIGDGYLLRYFAQRGLETTGVDISPYLVDHVRAAMKKESLDVRLICGDASTVNMEDNSLDVVTGLDVLEHIPGDGLEATIVMLSRCIQPDGVFIGSLPLGENLDDHMVTCPECQHVFHRIGHHHAFPTHVDIKKCLSPYFHVIQIGDVPFSLFKSGVLNSMAFKLYKLLCRALGLKKARTVYFIAKPNKS
ncbi:class I SAM-dependent methyltransferase [Planctomycetota bacterium]